MAARRTVEASHVVLRVRMGVTTIAMASRTSPVTIGVVRRRAMAARKTVEARLVVLRVRMGVTTIAMA
jgi:hypothetical protein